MTLNYTPEQTTNIIEQYQAGATVEVIALSIGKSVRSVVAKLSREKVLVAKSKAKAEARHTKAELIVTLATAYGVTPESLASLEKATKDALEILVSFVTESFESIEFTPE
jgi:D-arabinose 1-dehydrogenase-like Zn-dependent alcohol dehydrogenase